MPKITKLERFTRCNLRKILQDRNCTLTNFAEKMGVSYQQVQKYCHGINEMSLKLLVQSCSYLDCSPNDIYPEIEIYSRGFNIPKTRRGTSDTDADNNEYVINNVTNNYYNKPNFLANFFSNMKLLDINAKGAFLFKVAVCIIILDDILYAIFRSLGYPYPPFIAHDQLSQLAWAWIIFTWPMSFILPLLLRHWSVYIITIFTFRGILDVTQGYFLNTFQNQIDSHMEWLIKTLIAVALTLIYAYIVKKYLRKSY